MKKYLYMMLDQHFRSTMCLAKSIHFPNDEFNEQEQLDLKELCTSIAKNGYEHLEDRIEDPQFREVLNTAAEYGAFVSGDLSPSYLGIFVVAQMLMEPFASPGFSDAMIHSSVYASTDPMHQQMARLFMLLATFIPNKSKDTDHLEYLKNSIDDLSKLQVSDIDLEAVMDALTKK